jgi:hypothetical protein
MSKPKLNSANMPIGPANWPPRDRAPQDGADLPFLFADHSNRDTAIINLETGAVRFPVLGQPFTIELGEVLGTIVPAPEHPDASETAAPHAVQAARSAGAHTERAPFPSAGRVAADRLHADRPLAIDGKATKRLAQVRALNEAGVPNQHQAMAVWLAANWDGELSEAFGPHDPVHTIGRWRSAAATPRRRSRSRDRIRRLRRARQLCRESAFSRSPRTWIPGSDGRPAG